MVDIFKCNGDDCPKKDECYRHTAPSDEHQQSYMETPKGDKSVCEHFYHIPKRLYDQSGWR